MADNSMPLYDKTFWFAGFFLSGVLAASIVEPWRARFVAVAFVWLLLVLSSLGFRRYTVAVLSFACLLGAAHFFVFSAAQADVHMPFDEETAVTGVVAKAVAGTNKQELVIALEPPYRGTVSATMPRYPSFVYGDLVRFEGVIAQPPERAVARLQKNGVFGVMDFPRAEVIARGKGSPIKKILFGIKDLSESVFERILPPDRAAFISGLTLGDTSKIPREFSDAMRATGTTHVVALSGYNITIVVSAIMGALGYVFSRKKAVGGAVAAVIFFVIMTGAEASAVRAAIMAFILLLANISNRVFSPRNAIVVAAFAMVAVNPRILVWDVGFQLSFAAILGLVYLQPAITDFFKINPAPGFLRWRENLLTTISAQVAVLPILLVNFHTFTPLSILTNVLILSAVPITMTFGFLAIGFGLISSYAALLAGFALNLLLGYEMGVIRLFARFHDAISVQNFGIALFIAYYLLLIAFIAYAEHKRRTRPLYERQPAWN